MFVFFTFIVLVILTVLHFGAASRVKKGLPLGKYQNNIAVSHLNWEKKLGPFYHVLAMGVQFLIIFYTLIIGAYAVTLAAILYVIARSLLLRRMRAANFQVIPPTPAAV